MCPGIRLNQPARKVWRIGFGTLKDKKESPNGYLCDVVSELERHKEPPKVSTVLTCHVTSSIVTFLKYQYSASGNTAVSKTEIGGSIPPAGASPK